MERRNHALRTDLGKKVRFIAQKVPGMTEATLSDGTSYPAHVLDDPEKCVLRGVLEYAGNVELILADPSKPADQADLAVAIGADKIKGKKRLTCSTELSCGAVVFEEENGERRYLVVRAQKGHVGFPKGHREARETPHETASREVEEETGLQVTFIPGFEEESCYTAEMTISKRVICYLAKKSGGELRLQAAEIAAGGFYPFDKAMRMLTYPRDREILLHAEGFLKERNAE